MGLDTHIFLATSNHAALLAPRVRSADADEVRASGNYSPFEALVDSIAQSDLSWAAVINDEVVAIWGVRQHQKLHGVGVPWLITGNGIARHKKWFLRQSRKELRQMASMYPLLVQWVDARYTQALRWVEWLGFEVEPAQPFGAHDMPFHEIIYRSAYV